MRRDGRRFAFTCPAPRRYKHQWYWDSCFHAIAWTHIDRARAREELRTLVRSGRPDGFIPHTAFWQSSPLWRRAPLYATANAFGDTRTETIQTPLLAVAWERAADGDPAFIAEGLEPLAAHARWLMRERDPDGDGLLTILLPDESGLDDSPKYDAVYGHLMHWRPHVYARYVQRCRRAGWSAHVLCSTTDEHVEDVLVNVAHALSLRALGRVSGDPSWATAAARVESALLERCWDPRRGLFFDLAGRAERRVEVSTWSSLAPLVLEGIPVEIRQRLAEEHLLNPRRYGARFGVPSVSMEEPTFRPGFDRFRTWRGAAWMNTAWLMIGGLRLLGAVDEADALARGVIAAVERSGFREYYHPRTGSGHGERGFGFATLVIDLPTGFSPPSAGVAQTA